MKLEYLPNELLFDIFEFLDSIELLRIFSNLNVRFNRLLSIYLNQNRINFRSISQINFDILCQNVFQSFTNQIHSLVLSDDYQTPNLPSKFLAYHLSFDHLQSLTLHSIHSFEILNEFLNRYSQLTRLYLVECGYYLNKFNLLHLTNTIWSMPNLHHCQFDCFSIGHMNFPRMTNISNSIEYLSIENLHCDLTDLAHIFQHTPNLREFHPNIECIFQTEQLRSNFDRLTNLNLLFNGSKYSLEKLLQTLINLQRLKIHLEHIFLNGYEWKKLFEENYRFLKEFSLKMTFEFQQQIELDQLIDSFQTKFWLEQHQWFIRCDWFASNACLYTLPYAFDEFYYSNSYQTKSTCIDSNQFWIYNHVKKLIFETNSNTYPARFPNVRQLNINFLFDELILKNLINFNRILFLDILIRNEFSLELFSNLIQQMTRLYSLKMKFLQKFPLDLFQIEFQSIDRIDLMDNPLHYARYLTTNECEILENSSLIQQCRILVINLENRSNLIRFISKIKHLNSLIFRCKDEINCEEFQQWIDEHLSAKFLFSKDQKDVTINRLWRKI